MKKVFLLTISSIYTILITEGRLIVRTENQTVSSDGVQTVKHRIKRDHSAPHPFLRLSEFGQIHEATDKKSKRDSTENSLQKNDFNQSTSFKTADPSRDQPTKMKIELVKKPIPKYHEFDYEDEFDNEILIGKMKSVNEVDHEDDDFNLDDYDFDVNHDEFSGRGKPLEPRIKIKARELSTEKVSVITDKSTQIAKSQNKIALKVYQEDKPTNTLKKKRNNKRKIKPEVIDRRIRDEEDLFTEENIERVVRSLNMLVKIKNKIGNNRHSKKLFKNLSQLHFY